MQCAEVGARPEEAQWSTGGQQDEYFEWPVCRPHFEKLRSGAAWATHSDLPHSTRQWIAMDSDLDVRKTESVEKSSISVEFTETGRELRLEFTAGKERFDVLLDDDQALDLGLTVTELSTDEDLESSAPAGPSPRRGQTSLIAPERLDPPRSSPRPVRPVAAG